MDGWKLIGILIAIGVLSSFAWLTLLFQYIRGLLKKYEDSFVTKWTVSSLVIVEYILLALTIYIQLTKPYELVQNMGFHHNYAPNLGTNSTIDYLLMVVFVLICITSFRQTLPFYKTNTKYFITLTVSAILLMFVINYIYTNWFKHYTTDTNEIHLQQLTETIIWLFPTVLLIFLVTLFRIDKQKIIKTIFYTFIPIFLFYFLFLYKTTKFYFLTPQEYIMYYDIAGGHG